MDLPASLGGLRDIVLLYRGSEGGCLSLKSWTFTLPRQASYSNPYEGRVFAGDYPFSAGHIRRVPSTDPGSDASLQVEGITDGSSLLFDFVEFHGKDVVLHIRAKSLAGGSVTVIAGDDRTQRHELGTVEISGEAGAWGEYTCILTQDEILMFDPVRQFLDLRLAFHGAGTDELFVLSEFWFEELK